MADLGIVDADAFRSASTRYLKGQTELNLNLFFTLQVELWLRGHSQAKAGKTVTPNEYMLAAAS